MNVINKDVRVFEENKTYMFVADTIQIREVHKWADLVDGQLVDVKLQGLGFVTMKREGKNSKEMSVYPRFCYEVSL